MRASLAATGKAKKVFMIPFIFQPCLPYCTGAFEKWIRLVIQLCLSRINCVELLPKYYSGKLEGSHHLNFGIIQMSQTSGNWASTIVNWIPCTATFAALAHAIDSWLSDPEIICTSHVWDWMSIVFYLKGIQLDPCFGSQNVWLYFVLVIRNRIFCSLYLLFVLMRTFSDRFMLACTVLKMEFKLIDNSWVLFFYIYWGKDWSEWCDQN